jgi:hypothetical protein
MKGLFLFLLFISYTSFAQITITTTDINNLFAVGNSATIHSYEGTTFNIGSAGGGNNWDFTGLLSSETFNLLSVNPATTPHIGEFTGANIATYSQGDYEGNPAEIWSYLALNSALGNMGQAITSSAFPGIIITSKNNPASIEMQLPMTYGNSWPQSYVNTFTIPGLPPTTTNVAINVVVDAYGTMTLPGGANFEALRIRESMSVSGVVSVNYSFLAKNGANVTVSAVDENPPISGVIDIDWYDWNTPFTTDVEKISELPEDYRLSQNYPNPFNPTTNIEYSIPEASFVQIKVFDILGNEIATLVNEEQSAGTYRADFVADNLASGLYIAKLQAGNYSQTIKMSLLK